MFLWSWAFPFSFGFVFPVKLHPYEGVGRGSCIAVCVCVCVWVWGGLYYRAVCVCMRYVTAGQDLSMTRLLACLVGTHLNEQFCTCFSVCNRQKTKRQNMNGGWCQCWAKGRQHVKSQVPRKRGSVREQVMCEELCSTQLKSVTHFNAPLFEREFKWPAIISTRSFYCKWGKSADEVEEKECVSQSSNLFLISVY